METDTITDLNLNPEINAQRTQFTDSLKPNFDSDLLTKQTQSFEAGTAKKALIKGSLSIADLWTAVQESYESEWCHQEFILACYRAGCLYYASQKYARILNSSPTEPIASKMQIQIEALASKDRLVKTEKHSDFAPSRFGSLVAIIGLVIALFGFLGPNFRNLFGVGISIFVMAAGFRFFVARPN